MVRVRKQVFELTIEDILKCPAWEFALDEEGIEGQDEATVRPVEDAGEVDPSKGMYVVKAVFGLSDGTQMEGYLTPPVQGDSSIGTLQPIILTKTGQVMFWHGIFAPRPEELVQSYKKLGRTAEKVFPVHFKSDVPIIGGPIEGTLEGFMYMKKSLLGLFRGKTAGYNSIR